ncbi:MAG: DUF4835 family protein [Bacteroidota bacterium]
MNRIITSFISLSSCVLLLSVMILPTSGLAQELLCNVSIDASRIQSDRTVFDDMRENLSRYMNFNKWTNDEFQGEERIRCNMQIIVTSRPSPDYFVCNLNLQVYRPTYNATYETVSVLVADNKFSFRYVPFQQMTFVENTYNDNLTALLNYYAYVILGFDYATYSPNGGVPFFQKAQEIVNLATSASNEQGWNANEGTGNRNRYWLIENLLNSRYKGFHTVLYKYHRQGLDQMESKPDQARRAMMDTMREMQRLNRTNPLLRLTVLFFDTKDDELVKVFKNAFVNDKKEFLAIMQDVNPKNMSQYNSIME